MMRSPMSSSAAEAAPLRRIVFAGGFCSGKSSAINLMLRAPVRRTDIISRPKPVQVIEQGEDNKILAVAADGATQEVADESMAWYGQGVAEVRRQAPLPALGGVEISEVQSYDSDEWSHEALHAFAAADCMIWCTIGSQAWRLTEKNAMEQARREFKGPALLVVTRSDLFRDDADAAKVEARLRSEIAGMFDDVLFVNASAVAVARSDEDDIWEGTGGAALADFIEKSRTAKPRSERGLSAVQPSETTQRARARAIDGEEALEDDPSLPIDGLKAFTIFSLRDGSTLAAFGRDTATAEAQGPMLAQLMLRAPFGEQDTLANEMAVEGRANLTLCMRLTASEACVGVFNRKTTSLAMARRSLQELIRKATEPAA